MGVDFKSLDVWIAGAVEVTGIDADAIGAMPMATAIRVVDRCREMQGTIEGLRLELERAKAGGFK